MLRAELDDEAADFLAGCTLIVAMYKGDGAGGLKLRFCDALGRVVLVAPQAKHS